MSPADILAFGEGRCLGPAGTWPCSKTMGHEGDHSRFEEPPSPATYAELDSFLLSYVAPNLKEVQRRVDRLIAERNDLLRACEEMAAFLEDKGYEYHPVLERARAVIAVVR